MAASTFPILMLSLVVARCLCQSPPASPCPGVFKYELPGSDANRWYGVATLTTDTTLYGLWLNVVLDGKADILGNWAGVVTTEDNVDFKIENSTLKLYPERTLQLRFFIQYNQYAKTPRLRAIRLNGREICSADTATARPFDYTARPVAEETTRVEARPIREEAVPARNDKPEARPVYVEAGAVSGVNTYSILGEVSSQDLGSSDKKRPSLVAASTQTQTRPTDSNSRPIDANSRPTDSNIRPIDSNSRPTDTNVRPTDSYNRPIDSDVRPTDSYNRPIDSNARPVDSNTRPVYEERPTYETRPTATRRPTRPNRPSTTDFQDYNDDNGTPSEAEYFSGGLPSLHAVVSSNPAVASDSSEARCGNPVSSAQPLIVNGRPTMEKMWPWQVALYQTQTVDSKYICGGTLVSLRHAVTAAHCVTLKGSSQLVNRNTFTVFLGKHNLRTSVDGVQIRFLERITLHPQYNASVYSRDAAVLTLRQAAEYTEHVRPACPWPSDRRDLSHVVGLRGSVVGWGFDEKGLATEELHLVEMPVVEQETCIRSYSEFFVRFTSEYTYCAGFRDGRSVCNGDSGGGMVFRLGSRWHLRGLVSLSSARQNDARCDTSHYVIFTDLAKMGGWLADTIATEY